MFNSKAASKAHQSLQNTQGAKANMFFFPLWQMHIHKGVSVSLERFTSRCLSLTEPLLRLFADVGAVASQI